MAYKKYTLPSYPCTEDMWDIICASNKPVVVYGMGNGADKLISRLAKYGVEVSDFFASDGFVRGHSFHGKKVKSFSEIKSEYSDFIILLSFASSRPEVIDMLAELDREHTVLVPDMPVAGEDEYFDREFYNSHYGEILSAYGSLADEDSKSCFAAVVNYKLTGRMEYLLSAFSDKDEMYSLLRARPVFSYLDAGAYNGDTLKEAVEYFPSLCSAQVIEADAKNYKRLLRTVEEVSGVEVNPINAALWSSVGEGSFQTSGNRNSSVSSTSSHQYKELPVRLITVDSLELTGLDYIKYDVEGAEYEALMGSEGTISRLRPMLLVSLYHRSRDLYFLINHLKEKHSGYSFYLRRLRCLPAWELNLIMLPT